MVISDCFEPVVPASAPMSHSVDLVRCKVSGDETSRDSVDRGSRVRVFDTTLRDGQQCPGAGMTFEENLQYAKMACDLRIDVLEAGFPSASKTDFDIVHEIASMAASSPSHSSMKVAALCQLREDQVLKTIEALAPVIPRGLGRLHTYVPVDPSLMPASLGNKASDHKSLVETLYRLVKIAHDAGLEVQFSPEGYSRVGENFDFTTELIRAAVAAGATVINCPDTIGGACSLEGDKYFVKLMQRHAKIIEHEFPHRQITWSVHCHNDYGLAVQNTVNAVFEGPALQIEGCINGIGERAGNASLEQCVMIIKQFGGDKFHTGIASERLQEVSNFVSEFMLPRQPHWPVTGDNASRHSSGGHTNAILRNPLAYQPFDPVAVGKKISLLFGPLSGGNHAKAIIEEHGFRCDDGEKSDIAQFIKDKYSERRKGITDIELMRAYLEYRSPIVLHQVDYARHGEQVSVWIQGSVFGEQLCMQESISGRDSPLAAAKIILQRQFGEFDIVSHRSGSESRGVSARSMSRIVVTMNDTTFEGTAVDNDIEIAAIRALVDAINMAYVATTFANANIESVNELLKPGGVLQKALSRVS